MVTLLSVSSCFTCDMAPPHGLPRERDKVKLHPLTKFLCGCFAKDAFVSEKKSQSRNDRTASLDDVFIFNPVN